MQRINVLWISLTLAVGCKESSGRHGPTKPEASRADRSPTTAQESKESHSPSVTTTQPGPMRPAAAIWYDSFEDMNDDELPTRLIVGIWSDGTIIWSSRRDVGGKPYSKAMIDPTRIDKLLRALESAGLFDKSLLGKWAPDESHPVIAAEYLGQRKQLDVATRFAEDVPVWGIAQRLIEEIIPARGVPADSFDKSVFAVGRE